MTGRSNSNTLFTLGIDRIVLSVQHIFIMFAVSCTSNPVTLIHSAHVD